MSRCEFFAVWIGGGAKSRLHLKVKSGYSSSRVFHLLFAEKRYYFVVIMHNQDRLISKAMALAVVQEDNVKYVEKSFQE